MLRNLQIFSILLFGASLFSQPILKTPITSANAFIAVCSSGDFQNQKVYINCGSSYTPELLIDNIYKEIKWTFGNGNTYVGYHCPAQIFDKAGTYNCKVTVTSDVEFTVLKSVKIKYTNSRWNSEGDTAPDYYLDFFVNNARVLQSCYRSDTKAPVTFTLKDGYLLEKETKIDIFDYDPWSANDICGSLLIPKNSISQTITGVDAQIEIVTQKTKTATLDFQVIVVSSAAISEKPLSCDQATLTASGGNTYKWSTGATTKTITVGPGTYSVTVSTNGSCIANSKHTFEASTPVQEPIVECHDKYLICSNYENFIYWLDENKKQIAGAYKQIFNPTKPGTYYAEYKGIGTSTACRSISDGFNWPQCSIVSGTVDSDEKLVIYPNPTSGNLFVKGLSIGQTYDVEIINATGKQVKSLTGVDEGTIMNIDDLPNGMYFVKLLGQNDFIKMQKIIKSE